MAKFCGKCGRKLDEATGLCPNCDADKIRKLSEQTLGVLSADNETDQENNPKPSLHRRETKKNAEVEQAGMSTTKKVRRKFLKLILLLATLAFLMIVTVGILNYLGVVDIPIIATLLDEVGISSDPSFSRQAVNSCYIPNENNIIYENENKSFGYVNNIVLVFADKGVSNEKMEKIAANIGGKIVGEISGINQYQIQIGAMERTQLESLCATLMENDDIKFAIIDTVFTTESESAQTPNDPWKDTFQGIWGVDWDEKNPDGCNWWIEATRVLSAWSHDDKFSPINVGIVDNGFDTSHEDLSIHVLNNEVNNAENHGTHVAGIIGATINNKIGISGILNHVNLYGVDCYATSTQQKKNITVSSLMAGIVSCLDNQCKVINMSSATKFTSKAETKKAAEDSARSAIIYLIAMLDSYDDFIIIQAAGNGNNYGVGVDASQYGGYFASINENAIQSVFNEFNEKDVKLDNKITTQDILNSYMIVGAVDKAKKNGHWRLSEFSNYGNSITVCAPGVNVFSTIVSGGIDGNYGYMDGTSMAAPIVSGIVAMTWAVNPKMSASEVQDIIKGTASEIVLSRNRNDSGTYYMIDANAAVEEAINYTLKEQVSEIDNLSDIPSGTTEFNGHYYHLYDDSLTWQEAKEACEKLGGHLVTITSKDEQDFISDLVWGAAKRSYWIGLSDEAVNDQWTWVTGEPFSYSNWAKNEPNHGYGGYEHYVAIVSYDTVYDYDVLLGEWNDHALDRDIGNFGYICEWDSGAIDQQTLIAPVRVTSGERNVVLTLDVSGSMAGNPLDETKKAATNFVETILNEDASIGLVTYDDSAEMVSDFSISQGELKRLISELRDGGSTNIEAGLSTAYGMLNDLDAKKKIIVLMSDGEPNRGREGDELVAYADEIKKSGVLIYTLGFFENMSGNKSSAQILMERIASEGCHYEVANADDLVFFFDDVADQINGQRYIYVRIACPVDVSVTYNGETLNSSENNLNTRTDFGTLSFEENEESNAGVSDDRIKVLRLKEGVDYDIQIVGTGRGLMDYTIGFMDENGEYSDFRTFENVKITKQTVIDTEAKVSDNTILRIDNDGDGKYDLKLRAEENGYGEEMKLVPQFFTTVAVGGSVLLVAAIMVIMLKIRRKKKGKAV